MTVSCSIKKLALHELEDAALHAIKLNPVNRPAGVLEPGKIAVATSKFWGAGGVHKTVGFMGSISEPLARKILIHMNAWAKFCNCSFVPASVSTADLRVSFKNEGYYSYLGTDNDHIPRNQNTMNLQGFNVDNVPDSEYYRVVRHETGHYLGCVHEHMRREIVQKLDRTKAIKYFEQTQGWTQQEVMEQVLTPLDEDSLMHSPHAEIDSIMCYGLPGSITIDGVAIPGGLDITPDDGAFMGKIYPLAITPAPKVDWMI